MEGENWLKFPLKKLYWAWKFYDFTNEKSNQIFNCLQEDPKVTKKKFD